jgi:hypothetical protein
MESMAPLEFKDLRDHKVFQEHKDRLDLKDLRDQTD